MRALPAAAPAARPGSNRRIVVFLLSFGAWIGVFSILFQVGWIDSHLVLPMTEGLARVSNVFIRGLGFDSHVDGTVIESPNAPAINILKGCNGAYVLAIFVSAVLAFPSPRGHKLLGVALGIPFVQTINVGRIVSLYYIGARHPDLFESFHYHVWQSLVIILAMAGWILWAELAIRKSRG
ncbi:MAG: exosortase H [Acidobacteria bacterium]|nr:exosortase H [Acidobacteriota bacterium]